ncbi:glycosyltransferase family 8 protein [Mucilaginibacter lappiensis]|uniref:Lipopolysaccharide biosynthesis glycosyltransferase n=1 Tax=Mucilaginibacter lappiensis TaxID=354630 RepID=A0A841JMD8_9SPHI|nr:glycosyltransferase family 8 protein [Mucilaginibacter lappiensis]MBB6130756.1 lipopolysaccharide biosynthesis glycosyltransferase [Mucilaginibacter lappiensis]
MTSKSRNNFQEIPLVVAFTPNYFIPASVCIFSILDHSESTDTFHIICLLSEDLSEITREKLIDLGDERARFTFINLSGKLQDIYINEKYTVAASFRLLLPDLLPEYKQVMYIDCDVIVRNNLAKLYHNIHLGDYYLAAVFESPLDFQQPHIKAIGCDPGYYINSGFLFMNLKQLREDNMVPKFLEASKTEDLEFPDQDVLNQLCKGRVLGLPPYYNSIRTFYLPQYKPQFLKRYTEGDWQAVQEHGTIHYTGSKPWNSFTVQFEIWWQYYMRLPKDIRQMEKRNNMIYRLYIIYNSGIGKSIIKGLQLIYRKIKY